MEPVLFYGNHAASSFGSIVALEWLGQPYRLFRLDLPGDTKTDFYTHLNPAQKVPALLLENGKTLTESAAILHHLAWRDRSKGLTYDQGTPEFDHLNQVLAFVNTDYWSSFAPAFEAFDMDLKGEKDPSVQKMLRDIGRKGVAKAHAALEAMIGDGKWLAGDRRTIADAYFAGIARWVPFLASTGAKMVDQRDYPKLYRHIQKLETDPAVIFAHAIEDDKPAKSAGGFLGHVSLEDIKPRLKV
ncbi:MAG: glutathione S-transferase family protein [Rhizobiales bacterium]|nr:glutathione S-transferase family protein [Hyphomicrobiales bacterium]